MGEPFLPPTFFKGDLQDLEQWFFCELTRLAGPRFVNGEEHVWKVVTTYLREHGGAWGNLTDNEFLQIKSAILKLAIQTSHMVGVSVPPDVERKLTGWGWSPRDVRDFPGWAYRVALIKALIESGQIQRFSELVKAAQSHPLSEAERQAIEAACTLGLKNLKPVYDAAGTLIEGEALEKEKEQLRDLLIEALIQRTSPLKLAREMFRVDKIAGIYRDFERVARTEMANCFHYGSFRADQISGKFGDNDIVYRTSRPQACKLCIMLYTGSHGTPKLYRVQELLQETTPPIRVSGRGDKLYRAVIGVSHPDCLCSPWSKYYGEVSDRLFQQFAPQYLETRKRYRLHVS